MLRREDGNALRSALEFEVEGQWKKERLKGIWLRREVCGLVCGWKMHFADQSGLMVLI